MTETEIGVTLPLAKECQGWSATTSEFPSIPFGRSMALLMP